MALDLPAQIPTLIGSLLSCLATGAVLVVIIANWSTRHSLRHVLIANLILSDFTNSLNNTISGIWILAIGHIPTHAAPICIANGYIGQFTVQATDFSVLAMALSTLIIVTRPTVVPDSSTRTKILATIGIWLFPFISSTAIAGLHGYAPVSGNWCWISESRDDLRYGFAHGIRFAIIISTVIIYAVVFKIVQRKLNASTLESGSNIYGTNTDRHVATVQAGSETVSQTEKDIEMANLISKNTLVTVSVGRSSEQVQHPSDGRTSISPSSDTKNSNKKESGSGSAKAAARRLRASNRQNVAKIMLLKAYPLAYVVLWIPGIANRLAELSGKPSHVLVILQASTQFIGLVDAIVYIFQWRVGRRD